MPASLSASWPSPPCSPSRRRGGPGRARESGRQGPHEEGPRHRHRRRRSRPANGPGRAGAEPHRRLLRHGQGPGQDQAAGVARRDPADYRACVDELNQAKQAVFENLIGQLQDGETGAFLVWGDPMLYDSTIRNLDALKEGGLAFDYDVIPGITAIQALAAAHKIPLNRIAEAVTITTGRKLANGFPPDIDSVVVLLDGEDTFGRFTDQDMDIYWGAYLGTPNEILIAGKVKDVAEEIHRRRSEARRANGWIMDTYLLRRATTPSSR